MALIEVVDLTEPDTDEQELAHKREVLAAEVAELKAVTMASMQLVRERMGLLRRAIQQLKEAATAAATANEDERESQNEKLGLALLELRAQRRGT
ncbi:MAG: hypothetical protein AB7P03_21380 [Kofleriaceae bacterium]